REKTLLLRNDFVVREITAGGGSQPQADPSLATLAQLAHHQTGFFRLARRLLIGSPFDVYDEDRTSCWDAPYDDAGGRVSGGTGAFWVNSSNEIGRASWRERG